MVFTQDNFWSSSILRTHMSSSSSRQCGRSCRHGDLSEHMSARGAKKAIFTTSRIFTKLCKYEPEGGKSTLEKQNQASKHHFTISCIFTKLCKYEPGGGKSTPQIPNFRVSCSETLKNTIFKHVTFWMRCSLSDSPYRCAGTTEN